MKLRAFIGSSSEQKAVAQAIADGLSDRITCTVWWQGFFRLSRTTIETLSSRVGEFDVGIFVFGSDDKLRSRDVEYSAVRDNVLFEFGLFCGRLGIKRTIVVRSSSRHLKWLEDLAGYTTVPYDEGDEVESVKTACEKIAKDLQELTPQPGIYANNKWRRLYTDWWTYGGSESSSSVAEEDGIELVTNGKIGLRFPRTDNFDAKGRYCVIRLTTTSGSGGPAYIALRSTDSEIFLSLSDHHENDGWGFPTNEFMLRLPLLQSGVYRSFVVELERLKPFIGPIEKVTGFRLRSGLKASHFCVCDELPDWLLDAAHLQAEGAPLVTITQPKSDAVVGRRLIVKGTVSNLRRRHASRDDLQVFVLAPDGYWYPERPVQISGDKWQVKVTIGDDTDVANSKFQIACVTLNGQPASDRVRQLPGALARSIVRVTRKT